MEQVYFLEANFLGKTPRKCRLIKKSQIRGHPRECWVAVTYPSIVGLAPNSPILLELVHPKRTLADVGHTFVGVDVILPRTEILKKVDVMADIIESEYLVRLDIAQLLLPKQVPKSHFPFDR